MKTFPPPSSLPLHLKEYYDELCATLTQGATFLPDKPEESSDSTLRALWFSASGNPKSTHAALVGDLPLLSEQAVADLKKLIERRIQGEPLSHLTGRQHFFDMEMLAGPGALVPRKETELLARSAVDLARQVDERAPNVLDICTGSGNVAVAVAHNVANAIVYAADLSEAAVELARRNAQHLGLEARVEFRVSDLLAAFDSPDFLERFDVISCNPPYINTGKVGQLPKEIAAYEPRLAFDGGSLGITILMRLLAEAPRFLRKGGWLTFEVGLGQGRPIAKRLQASSDYQQVQTLADHEGHIRVVSAQR